MRFVCDRDDMTAAVASVQKAVSAKSTITYLEGINITASTTAENGGGAGGKLVLFGTDNEIGIECTVAADVEGTGSAVVNAKLFGDIVRNLPGDTVTVETIEDTKIRVRSGEAVFELFIIQTDAFPPFPDVDMSATYAIDQFTLKRMLSQTSFAIGTDESRKTLTGLFLESGDGELRAVAVDGYRIALRRQPVETADHEISMIIPSRTIGELIRIIPSTIGELRLCGGGNQAVILFGNCRVYTRVINGEFFNYRYILPNEYMTQVTVRRQALLEAVERAALIISSEFVRRYPVVFNVANDRILIKALSDVGNVNDGIDVEMEGEAVEAAFNPRFMTDALRAIEDEQIVMRFTSSIGQCTIRPVNNESYVYLILPIKTG